MSSTRFRVRDAQPKDTDFIVASFDSTLPHLDATGNGGQWGTEPFSEREGFKADMEKDVKSSESHRMTGEGEPLRMFVAEAVAEDEPAGPETADSGLHRRVDETGTHLISVGHITIRCNSFAKHVYSLDVLKPVVAEAEQNGQYIFIDVLITDYRTGSRRRGAGTALLDHVKKYAKENGYKTLYIDFWTGGTGKLAQYYKGFGFKSVNDYEFKRKNGTIWSGTFMSLDV